MKNFQKQFLLLCCFCCLVTDPTVADEGAAVTSRIRIEWGEQVPRLWNARFEFPGGTIKEVKSLGVDADETAVISLRNQQVVYQPRTSRVFNSVEIKLLGNPTSKLKVVLQDHNNTDVSLQREFVLQDILRQNAILPIPQTNAQLIVQQAPGEKLTIRANRTHLVYAPDELISLTVFPRFLQSSEESPGDELTWNLSRARHQQVIAKGTVTLKQKTRNDLVSEGIPVSVDAPEEGVYNLTVHMPSGQSSVVQFVVLTSEPQGPLASHNEEGALLIDRLSLNRPQDQRELVDRRTGHRIRKSLRSLFKNSREVPPHKESDISWAAYHLKLKNPGQPHKLVITRPARQDAHLGFSLLEPDAAGQLVPVGIDSGVYHRAATPDFKTENQESTVEMLFWPRVSNPVLLFHSLGMPVAAEVSHVEVYELTGEREVSPPTEKKQGDAKRLVGPYLQKPLLPEIFGATQVLDPQSHRSLDDWQTFYEAGTRLVDYLKYHRYNSVLLGVSADGSSIYPSQHLNPTPRYDSGVYHTSGQDILRKDILELLFQLFDRAQLALIPELQFSSIIASLEQLLQEHPDQSTGIELVNLHGQTWRNSQVASRGQAPFYNPLNPLVQAEIVKIFKELAGRYQGHSSFRGVAVQLSLNGYLQLPGLDWGYDDATIAQFEKETGVKIPVHSESQKYEKRYQYLTTTALPQWTEWRCQKIRTLHQQLANTLAEIKPDAQLIFSARELIPAQSRQGQVISALKTGAQFKPILMEMGLDFSRYDQISNAVVMRPERFAWGQQSTADLQFLNTCSTIDDSFRSRMNGVLFYHQPVEIRIPEFDQLSPWQPAFTWLASQASPAGASNRIRYVRAIAALDPYITFDGGWTIPFGQEQSTRSIRAQLSQLPARPFQTINESQQPVITRFSWGKEKSVFYLVNDFPYPCEATFQLAIPTEMPVVSLESGAHVKKIKTLKEFNSYTIQLDAYDFQAFEVEDAQARLISVKSTVQQSDLEQLQARIDQKKHMLVQFHQSLDDSSTVVFKADFEGKHSRDYILAGWESKVDQGVTWNLDTTEAHSGRTSLLLDTKPGKNFLRTNSIPLEDCRYLKMGVWMKSRSKEMRVRIAMEAEQNGKLKVQSAIIGVDQHWRKYVFRVKDIPSDQIQNAHIVIEKLGGDYLWIDDVDLQIHQISPEDDRQLTKLISTLALAWDSKRYLDCYRLLERYWGQFGEQITPLEQDMTKESQPAKHVERRGIRKLIRR